MEEAFTKIAATNGGQMDGDGIRVNQLPLPVEPVLQKPAPQSFGMLSQYTEDEDSLAFTFSMSFSFSSTATGHERPYGNERHSGYWQAANGNTETSVGREEERADLPVTSEKIMKKRCWAVKAQVGMALPAEDGTYKIPVSALFKSSFGRTAFTLSGYTRAGKRDTGRYEESRPLCYRRRSGG